MYHFIRIKAETSDLHELVTHGVFVGQYSHTQRYFEAVATSEVIETMRSYGWDVFDGEDDEQ